MKTLSKLILAATVATGLAAFTANADDLKIVQIPNGHGQFTTLYRPANETSVALYVRGMGVGVTAGAAKGTELEAVQHNDGHGHTHTLYREVR